MEHSRVIEWVQATAGQKPLAPAFSKNPKKQNKKEKEAPTPAAVPAGKLLFSYCTAKLRIFLLLCFFYCAQIINPCSTLFTPLIFAAPYKNFTQPPLVVADIMGGVGPFAVPLSMPVNLNTTSADREIIVHANGEIAGCLFVLRVCVLPVCAVFFMRVSVVCSWVELVRSFLYQTHVLSSIEMTTQACI